MTNFNEKESVGPLFEPPKEGYQPPRSANPGAPRRTYNMANGQRWVHDANVESLESPYGNDETVERIYQKRRLF